MNDPSEGPMLVPIPANTWKKFVQVCEESDDLGSSDYRMFATIICVEALSGYTDRKRKRNAKKKEQPKND